MIGTNILLWTRGMKLSLALAVGVILSLLIGTAAVSAAIYPVYVPIPENHPYVHPGLSEYQLNMALNKYIHDRERFFITRDQTGIDPYEHYGGNVAYKKHDTAEKIEAFVIHGGFGYNSFDHGQKIIRSQHARMTPRTTNEKYMFREKVRVVTDAQMIKSSRYDPILIPTRFY